MILPTLIILFLPINITAFASSTSSLIDSDLRNWDKYDSNTTVNWTKGYYQIGILKVDGETLDYCIGAIYDLSSLNSGYSYKLNFYTVLPSEMGLADTRIYNQLNYGSLVVGLASYDNSSNKFDLVDGCCVTITKDNYARYFGHNTEFTFTMPNIENPCIVITYNGYGNTVSTFFGFKDFSLIDTEAEKEQSFLDNLFQWFEDKFSQLFNVLLYLDPNGDENYINPFPINDNDVNGADNLEHLQNGINQFVNSVENLTMYLRVPSQLLTNLGERMPIIPIVVVFTLVGLVVMRLFGVRRDS